MKQPDDHVEVRKTPFDFGLSEPQEQRALKLHADNIVFDWLSQHVGGANIFAALPQELRAEFETMMAGAKATWEVYRTAIHWPYELALQGRSSIIEEWYRLSGLTCGTHNIELIDPNRQERPFDAVTRYGTLPWLRYITTADEVRRAKRDRIVSMYGNCQPVIPIPRDLRVIDEAYSRGLRSLMLTYNRMDHVGVGCTERVDAGLSMFGVELVKHCESLGVIVDTSHCGHLTTLDACRQSKNPVNANHTCAKALCDVARAKSDEALKAIADTGGVIGIVTVPFFVSKHRRPSINLVLDQIEYVADLVGWRHVSLGTDWPNQVPDETQRAVLGPLLRELGFRDEDRIDVTDRINGFDDYRDLPNITRGLVARGWSDEQIIGVLGQNALRVFEQVCG
jgi:membrane dipeptidase